MPIQVCLLSQPQVMFSPSVEKMLKSMSIPLIASVNVCRLYYAEQDVEMQEVFIH